MSDVMTELIDVLDENGNKTGEVETKEEIYKRGLWHRSVHIWIENDKQELLVQKRNPLKNTFPNLWAISSAGHVIAGETSIESGLRELKEELDVDAKKEDFPTEDLSGMTNEFTVKNQKTGYYYRVVGVHYVESNGKGQSFMTKTEGIKITEYGD